MSAEIGLGAVLGRSLVDQLATYGSLAGAIGLAAQVIFAMFPVFQGGGGRPRSDTAFRTAALSNTDRVYRSRSTNSVADIPSVRDSNRPNQPIWVWARNRAASERLNAKLSI